MNDRRILSTWKEIAAYLSRGVRTVQRWELTYRLPIRRHGTDTGSVYAFADEIDAWLSRTRPASDEYVRPTVLVVDVISPDALSDLKLSLEGAKFNVLTAFTRAEMLATAQKYPVDGFVVDSIILDLPLAELGAEIGRRCPGKPRVLVGDESVANFERVLPSGNPGAVVECVRELLGTPRLVA
jgi:hypothetical protein